MANKFLPFIVEKSPLDSIYTTMLSRSKGINTMTLLSVLHAVGALGITRVRDFVDAQNSDISTEALYQAISGHFNNYSIRTTDFTAFSLLRYQMSLEELSEGNPKFKEFSPNDMLGFILVATLLNKHTDYFSIDYRHFLDNHDALMEDIPQYIKLSDESENVVVTESIEDLKGFLFYRSFIRPEPGKNYCLKLEKGVEDDKPF